MPKKTEHRMYDLSAVLDVEAMSSIRPGSSILVSGPAMSGKEELALSMLADGSRRGDGAIIMTTGDPADAVIAAEEALLGEESAVNVREMDATFDGVFERATLAEDGPNRRTGFIGEGLPADNQEVNGVPDSEPVRQAQVAGG